MGIESVKLKEIKFSPLNKQIPFQNNYDWESLTENIKKEGFVPEKYGYITISKDGVILNGHHRYVVLKKIHNDDDYVIKVFRRKFNYIPSIFFSLLFLLTIVLPLNLIKNVFKYFNSHSTNKKKVS